MGVSGFIGEERENTQTWCIAKRPPGFYPSSNIQEAEAPGRSPAERKPVMKSGIFVRTIVAGCVYREVADFGGFASSGMGEEPVSFCVTGEKKKSPVAWCGRGFPVCCMWKMPSR